MGRESPVHPEPLGVQGLLTAEEGLHAVHLARMNAGEADGDPAPA
jgi:hypothetical protein